MGTNRLLIIAGMVMALFIAGRPVAGEPVHQTSISPRIGSSALLEPATGRFLVARRGLTGYNFMQTVVYLLHHDEDGTQGVIINRPIGIRLSEAVENIEHEAGDSHAIYFGGPVGLSRIIMLIRNTKESPLVDRIDNNVYLSMDRRIMNKMLREDKPGNELHFYLGHAGWGSGQLAQEIDRGSWHVIEGDTNTIFGSDLRTLWKQLIRQLEPTGIRVENRFEPAPETGWFDLQAEG
jgi:putative transcriptional regulator